MRTVTQGIACNGSLSHHVQVTLRRRGSRTRSRSRSRRSRYKAMPWLAILSRAQSQAAAAAGRGHARALERSSPIDSLLHERDGHWGLGRTLAAAGRGRARARARLHAAASRAPRRQYILACRTRTCHITGHTETRKQWTEAGMKASLIPSACRAPRRLYTLVRLRSSHAMGLDGGAEAREPAPPRTPAGPARALRVAEPGPHIRVARRRGRQAPAARQSARTRGTGDQAPAPSPGRVRMLTVVAGASVY